MPKDIRFYHYTATPLRTALGTLLIKALDTGKRAIILTKDDAQTKELDEGLWTFKQEAFLDHGHGSDPAPHRTRIWLTHDENDLAEPANNADMLVIAGGQTYDDAWPYDLICDFFDGHDATAVDDARKRWTLYKEQSHNCQYFQQNDKGSWQKK